MAAATLCPWMTAATEHGPEVQLLRSTKMSANVVFITMVATLQAEGIAITSAFLLFFLVCVVALLFVLVCVVA